MVKKSLKGGDGKFCGIDCTTPAGNTTFYKDRIECPSWIPSATKLPACHKPTVCADTYEPAERCIKNGAILDDNKDKCEKDSQAYWGHACVPKRFTRSIGNFGGKNKKKQTKKSKKHMKKTKKNRRK